MKKYIVILLFAFSCSEDIGPCYAMEQQCASLLRKMEQATTPAEKEQYRQRYLSEKHLLDYCYYENGK